MASNTMKRKKKDNTASLVGGAVVGGIGGAAAGAAVGTAVMPGVGTAVGALVAVRDAHDRTIKLHEERLNVAKEPVTTGEVSVRKEVVKDRQKIDVPVEREEVVVTRRKAHGPASRSDIHEQTEEIRIPVK